ncbi:hypothetical protein OSB04_011675 [Centaurea solstitialis]|uniref:Uncharacterized protein n=1 Tax=Centaurea solstitialis TaxID=347529 RepID=A0AA38WQ83_9ASTR|nr:hypothetical protein OSB04_011675 [Centaurea solstitialis]
MAGLWFDRSRTTSVVVAAFCDNSTASPRLWMAALAIEIDLGDGKWQLAIAAVNHSVAKAAAIVCHCYCHHRSHTIASHRRIANTVTNTNKSFSLLYSRKRDKLTRFDFFVWERNLMIALRHERKWYALEKASRLINTNDMIRQLRDMPQTQARTEHYDAIRALNTCTMAKGTSLSMGTKTKDVLVVKNGEVKKKRGHGNTSKGRGQVLATLSAPRVNNNGKGKSKGKKVKSNRVMTKIQYFKCHEVGHWRHNCPKRYEAGINTSGIRDYFSLSLSPVSLQMC